MELKNNTILITGGATGIGFGLAEAFLREGSTVIVTGRREGKLLEARAKLPGLHVRVCDVADAAQREDLAKWAVERFPALNVLVNNAGIQRDIDLTKGVEDLLSGEDELKVDLEAPIYLSALLLPHFLRQERAAILNVTSGIAFVPSVKSPLYSATKAALHTFSIALRQRLKETDVRVFEVVPPMVLDTGLNAEGRAKSRAAAGGVPDEVRFAFLKPPSSATFAAHVLAKLAEDVPEIGYGTSEAWLKAPREELDRMFRQMNGG